MYYSFRFDVSHAFPISDAGYVNRPITRRAHTRRFSLVAIARSRKTKEKPFKNIGTNLTPSLVNIQHRVVVLS